MTDLHNLLERVRAATGPDRELDADIHIALVKPGWVKAPNDPGAVGESAKMFWPGGKLRYHTSKSGVAPSYTASLDAAISLIERVYPDWHWEVGKDGAAMLREPDDTHASADHVNWGDPPTTAVLGLLTAFLAAKIEMEGRENG